MIRGLRRLIVLGGAVLALTLAGVVVHALWLTYGAGPPEPARVIIVLGGGMEEDGTLAPETARRAEFGAELYAQGLAPRIHFTGGPVIGGLPGPGDQMRAVAMALGVPAEVTSTENASRSTLQNALFSREMLGDLVKGPVILVSDGYHLGRSWVSFRWAGYGPPIELAAATAFGDRTPPGQALRLVREATAWWFNGARMGLWYGMTLAGVPESRLIDALQ